MPKPKQTDERYRETLEKLNAHGRVLHLMLQPNYRPLRIRGTCGYSAIVLDPTGAPGGYVILMWDCPGQSRTVEMFSAERWCNDVLGHTAYSAEGTAQQRLAYNVRQAISDANRHVDITMAERTEPECLDCGKPGDECGCEPAGRFA